MNFINLVTAGVNKKKPAENSASFQLIMWINVLISRIVFL
jgi:hypothetical protein